MFKAIVLGLSLATAFDVAPNVQPRAIAMQDLTIPPERLPSGCGLQKLPEPTAPTKSAIVTRGVAKSLPFMTSNPWVGADPHALAYIRQVMDGPPVFPDEAPLTKADATRFFLRYAEGIEQGYAADYLQSDGRLLAVHALKFTSLEDATRPRRPDASTGPRVTRVDIGSIVAIVYGDTGVCTKTIVAHLTALGR
jgi:hypothetical protein